MTGRAAAEAVGRVELTPPTGSTPYYRLRWTEPDGTRRDTTAGRDHDTALAKALAVDRRLARAAGPAALTRLDGAAPRGARRERRAWSPESFVARALSGR